MKYMFIDIRKSDEVYKKRIQESDNYKIYNIPMNMIQFNKELIIKHLKWVDEIYIICRSGSRSQFIKNKYFSNIQNIKVNKNLQMIHFTFGKNNFKINNDNININIVGSNSFNLYSMLRITQIILGTLILTLGGYTLYKIKLKNESHYIPLIILILFGINALINGLTSTCTLSKIFIDYLN